MNTRSVSLSILIKRNSKFARKHFSTEAPAIIVPQPDNKVTVDAREIENFSKLASEWWNTTGPLKGLHSLNDIRIPFIRDGIISTGIVDKSLQKTLKVLSNINILEVGCGGGILTESLARIHANVTAIDATKELIDVAKDHAKSNSFLNRIDYRFETIEEHAKNNKGKYDAVIASEVVEHISNKELFLEACTDALKPGGSMFITTLNKTLASWLGGIVISEYLLKLVPVNTHEWDKFVAPIEVQRMLDQYHCNTVMVHGMFYKFWNNTWCWVPSTEISYAIHAIKQ